MVLLNLVNFHDISQGTTPMSFTDFINYNLENHMTEKAKNINYQNITHILCTVVHKKHNSRHK